MRDRVDLPRSCARRRAAHSCADASASRRYARPGQSTVTSYQRMPCTPVTTPIILPSSSRIGPCSICSSNIAPNLRCPPARVPRIADARRARRRSLMPSRSCCAIGVIAREHAGEDAGGQHRRREARALLVGPVDELDRRVGLDSRSRAGCAAPRARRARRARRRTCRRSAGCRDASPCRSAADRSAAGRAREHVADLVDADCAAERLARARNQSRTALVFVGQRQPPDAALRACRRNCAVSISVSHSRCGSIVRLVRSALAGVVTVSLMAPPSCCATRPRRRNSFQVVLATCDAGKAAGRCTVRRLSRRASRRRARRCGRLRA